ncbi:MAG: hypothetical protein WCH40_07030 [Verrucomicrobiales bacterium]
MNKEQARFILHSFRPDGADAADSDFAQALHLAAEDRELGEWLARERARDAEVSRGIVHLIIFRREDFYGDVSMDGKPRLDQSGGWAVASWGAADEVFVLVGDTTIERLAALF